MPIQRYDDPLGMEDLFEQEVKDNEGAGTIGRSFESGMHGMASSANAAAAAVARILGADDYAKSREQVAREQATRAAGASQGVTKFNEIGGLGDAADWATGAFWSNVPLLATMAVTGTGGGIAGAAARGRAGVQAAARKTAEKAAERNLLSQGMSRAAARDKVAAEGIGDIAEAAAARRSVLSNAIRQGLEGSGVGATTGRLAGVALPYGAMTTGETYMSILNDPNASGTAKEHAMAAIASGTAQAALGLAFEPVGMFQRVARASRGANAAASAAYEQARRAGLSETASAAAGQAARKASGSMAPVGAFALGAAGEGATEAGEQFIQQETHQAFNPEVKHDLGELAESAVAGMIVGGGTSAPALAMGHIESMLRRDKSADPTVLSDEAPASEVHPDLVEPVTTPLPIVASNEDGFVAPPPELRLPEHTNIVDSNSPNKDLLQIPDSIAGLYAAKGILFNGRYINAGGIKREILSALESGEPVSSAKLFAEARRSQTYTTSPHTVTTTTVGRDEKGNAVVEGTADEVINLRNRPLMDRYGIQVAKIKSSGAPLDTAGFREGLAALSDDMYKKGLVPVGVKDNKVYFASREARKELFSNAHLNVDQEIPNDLNMLMRVGTFIGRESDSPAGEAKKIKVEKGMRLHANDPNPDTDHFDGVIAKMDGQPLTQGTVVTSDGRVIKGAMNPTLIIRGSNFTADEGGRVPRVLGELNSKNYTMERAPTGEVLYYDPQGRHVFTREAQSVNRDFELGKTDAGQGVAAKDYDMEFWGMGAPTSEGAGAMSMQGTMFNLADPVRALRRDRDAKLRGKMAQELLADGNQRELFDAGVPMHTLLHPEDLISKLRTVEAPSSRAFAVPSKHVEVGTIMLSPAAFERLNKVLTEVRGTGLQIGETLNMAREPAMTDASGFAGFKFGGIAESTAAEDAGTEFLVVNPSDQAAIQQNMDFDGDRGNLYQDLDWLQPRGMITDVPTPNFQASGVSTEGMTEAQAKAAKKAAKQSPIADLQGKADYLDSTVALPDGGERDALAQALVNSDLGFSQMVGMIISQAQVLAEMNQLGRKIGSATVKGVKADGTADVGFIETTAGMLTKAIAQASIDAKKKKSFVKEALDAFDRLKDLANDVRPEVRNDDGTVVVHESGKRRGEPMRQPTFGQHFGNIARAPVSTNSARSSGAVFDSESRAWVNPQNPETKLDHIYRASVQARQVMNHHGQAAFKLLGAAVKRNAADPTSEEFRAALQDQLTWMVQMGVSGVSADTALAEVGKIWRDNLKVGVAPKMAALVDRLYSENPGIRPAAGNFEYTLQTPMHTELAYRMFEVKRIADYTRAFDSPKLPTVLTDAARAIATQEMSLEALEELAHWTTQYNALSQEVYKTDKRFEEEKFDHLTQMRTDVGHNIKLMFYSGRATAAGLIGYAPPHLVVRTLKADKFREVAKAADMAAGFRARLVARVNGITVAPRSARPGFYKIRNGQLILQQVEVGENGRYDPSTAKDHPDNVALTPQFATLYDSRERQAEMSQLESAAFDNLRAEAESTDGFVLLNNLEIANESLGAKLQAAAPHTLTPGIFEEPNEAIWSDRRISGAMRDAGQSMNTFDALLNMNRTGVFPKDYAIVRKIQSKDPNAWQNAVNTGWVLRISRGKQIHEGPFIYVKVASVERKNGNVFIRPEPFKNGKFPYATADVRNGPPGNVRLGYARLAYRAAATNYFNAWERARTRKPGDPVHVDVADIPLDRQVKFREHIRDTFRYVKEKWAAEHGPQARIEPSALAARHLPPKLAQTLGTSNEVQGLIAALNQYNEAKRLALPAENEVMHGFNEGRPYNDERDTQTPIDITSPSREVLLAGIGAGFAGEPLNNAATGISRLFSIPVPRVVDAAEMYKILLSEGQEAAAKPLLAAAASGLSSGARGMYLRRRSGEVVIYIGATAGTAQAKQMAVLAHELGHHLVGARWAEIQQKKPNIARDVKAEFAAWADANKKEQTNTEFHEWMADNIGAWLAQDKEVRTVADYVFKALAELLNSMHTYLRRTWNRPGQPPVIEGSVIDFMEAVRELAKTERTHWAEIEASETGGDRTTEEKTEEELPDLTEEIVPPEGASTVPPPHTDEAASESKKADAARLRARLAALAATPNPSPATAAAEAAVAVDVMQHLMSQQDIDMLRRVVQQPDMRRRLEYLLGAGSEASRRSQLDPDLAVAYLYAFTQSGIMPLSQSTSPQTIKALGALRKLVQVQLRQVQDATGPEVETIIQRMVAQPIDPSAPLLDEKSPGYRLYRDREQRYLRGLDGGIQRTRDLYRKLTSWYVDVPYQRVLDTQRPTLIAAMRALQPMAWELGGTKAAGYLEQTNANFHTAAQRAAVILRGLSPEESQELRDLLFNVPGATAGAKAREAHQRIQGLLAYLYKQERASGLDVPHRSNYWPMILDHGFIRENMESVIKTYTETPEFQKGWNNLKSEYLTWRGREASSLAPPDKAAYVAETARIAAFNVEQFARHYLEEDSRHGLPNTKLSSRPGGGVHTPGFRFMNPRALNFLLETKPASKSKEDVAAAADLHRRVVATLESDTGQVLARYIRSSARRSAWSQITREMHPDGIKGVIEEARRRDGATDADIDLFVRAVDAINGMLGIRERDALNSVLDAFGENSFLQGFKAEPGQLMNERVNAARQFTHAYVNVTKLTLAAAAASVDPLGQLLRHGSGSTFAQSITESRAMLKALSNGGGLTDIQEVVRDLGTIEAMMTVEDLIETYEGPTAEADGGSNTISGRVIKGSRYVQDKFFTLNQVARITEFSRMMATFAAVKSLKKWAAEAQGDGPEARIAQRQLASLGLNADDVRLGPDGNISLLKFEEREQLMAQVDVDAENVTLPEEIKRDDRVRAAVHRFVDESTVRPTPANRPLSASNPYYSVFRIWEGFITAFDNQILRPAWARLDEEGNATPLMWMALTFIPMMLFADMLRDAAKTALDDDTEELRPRWKQGWTLADHVIYAIERSGFYGRHELVTNILQPLEKGDVPKAFTEFAGVAVSDARKVLEYGPSERNLPAGDLWGSWG